VDYTSIPSVATFTAGTTSTTINILVTTDNIAEGPEMFDLSFRILSLSENIIPGNIRLAIGNITDNTGKTSIIAVTNFYYLY